MPATEAAPRPAAFPPGAPEPAERRIARRIPYRATIRVAPFEGEWPATWAFRDAETRDLSPQGVSFFSLIPPSTPQLLLVLGTSDAPLYVVARVARCLEGYWDRKRRFLVGCELLRRIPQEEARRLAADAG